jgi:glutaredoxin
MKKFIIALFACVILYAAFDKPKSSITPVAAKHQNVILYSTSWCKYCKKTRDLFEARHIQYTDYDIEKSNVGRLQYDQFNIQGVPVIDVRGLIVSGYDEDEILEALKAMKVL